MRPRSVRLAEQLYLAGVLLVFVTAVMGWKDAVAVNGPTVAFLANAVGVGLSLLLLLLTTRRASRIALWSLVVWTAVLTLSFLFTVSEGILARGLFGVLTVVEMALMVVAVVLLFRPAARAWFAHRAGAPEDVEA